jgi:ribosome-associated protein
MSQRPAPGRQAAREADAPVDELGRPSRSAKKRHAQGLQALGSSLAELPPARLASAPMPEALRDAFEEYERTRSHEGRRRQMQYIGKLMHQADETALREFLAESQLGGAKATLNLHRTERWRERLVDEDDALTQWLSEYPQSDAQQLRSLIRQARSQRQADTQPGAAPRQNRAWRELFQFVKAAQVEGAVAPSEASGADE